MLSPQQAKQSYESSPVICGCGEPGRLVQARKENGNMNRWFWTCSKSGCNCLFKWADGGPNMVKAPAPPRGSVNTPPPHLTQTPTRSPAMHHRTQGLPSGMAHGSASHTSTGFVGGLFSSPPAQRPVMASARMPQATQHQSRPGPGLASPQAPQPVLAQGFSPLRRRVAAPALGPGARGRPMPASLAPQAQAPGTPLRGRPHRCPDPANAPFSSGAGIHFELSTGERMPPSQAARQVPGHTSAPLLEIHELELTGEIGVTFSYNEEVKDSLKETFSASEGRSWDPDSRMWKLPGRLFEEVKEWALSHFDESLIRLPGQESAAVHELPPRPASMPEVGARLSVHLTRKQAWEKLYEFQRDGIRFALRHHGRALIADDMGTGKTVQAICIAACYNTEWPLLIVCPSSVTITWLEALYTWLSPDVLPKPEDIVVITSGKDMEKKLGHARDAPKRRIVITSYDLAQKLHGYERHFGMVICDESHALKTPTSKRTQFFRNLLAGGAAKRVLFLTGTPALSRPIELYTQIDMLQPGLLGSYDDFGKHFCGKLVSFPGGKKEYKGAKNKEELNRILTTYVMLRRLKKDVLGQIPPLQRSRISVLPDPAKLKEMEEVKEELRKLTEGGQGELTEEQYQQKQQLLLMKWYRTTGPAKLEAGIKHIEGLIEQGRKVVVFAHHSAVLDGLEEAVQHMKYTSAAETKLRAGHMRIDGSTSAKQRSEHVKTFQGSERCRVALLSIKAAGAGITLSAANTVVFLELFWNPGDLTQAEARAHRIGQEQEVQVQYLVCPGSADDVIWSIVNSKLQVVGTTLDGNAAGTAAGLRITSTDDLRGLKWRFPATEDDELEVLPTPEVKREAIQQPERSDPRRRSRARSPTDSRTPSPPRPRRKRLEFSEAPSQPPISTQQAGSEQRHVPHMTAGSGTGVFAEQGDDGFDDAVANMDVGEAVAASQQGIHRNRSPSPEPPGHGRPTRRMTAASGASQSMATQPYTALDEFQGQADSELLAALDTPERELVLNLVHRRREQRAAQPAMQEEVSRTQLIPPPDERSSGAGPHPADPPQEGNAEMSTLDMSALQKQPQAESQTRRSTRQQRKKKHDSSHPEQQQQQGQQQEAAVSAWDYPQPVTRRRRVPKKEFVDLTGES